ncbi:CPBP family intramembrane glutamic endopeptidase [Paenibacillus senegalensis]|uniref:CPBP family intramembrane glutamic endopeptidase n=1 Tax=Paenibacillus senegalensis TaxID=1465766 RepID=UPI000289B3E1|nr:CPBP family intramembrane glutamic endopeptidase [Paenibacillus senegalensis]
MELLMEYSLRVTPGLLLIALCYFLLPHKSVAFRIFLLIFGFILVRDVMTPLGFWQFGTSGGTVWVRFIENGPLLLTLGAVSLVLTAVILRFNRRFNSYLLWIGPNKPVSVAVGLAGALVVLAPFFVMYLFVPIGERGGIVPTNLLLPLLCMALLGNFMEEVLFRGYVQGYLAKLTTAWRAAILSGLLFGAGHIFLASTVTDLGIAVLLFTVYEGIVCGVVRMKYGIVASTLTHGLTIFVLASGLI